MENNYNGQPEETQKRIELTDMACLFLTETAKWAKFLAILGFIGIGFMVLFAIFFVLMMSKFSSQLNSSGVQFQAIQGWIMSIGYLIGAVIYIFPVYYLYKFANKTSKALNANDTNLLTEGLRYLKSHYLFIGILAIIAMVFYAFLIIFSVVMIIAISAMGII